MELASDDKDELTTSLPRIPKIIPQYSGKLALKGPLLEAAARYFNLHLYCLYIGCFGGGWGVSANFGPSHQKYILLLTF